MATKVPHVLQLLQNEMLIHSLMKDTERYEAEIEKMLALKAEFDKSIALVGDADEIGSLLIQARDDRKTAFEELGTARKLAAETVSTVQAEVKAAYAKLEGGQQELKDKQEELRLKKVNYQQAVKDHESRVKAVDKRNNESLAAVTLRESEVMLREDAVDAKEKALATAAAVLSK